MLKPKFAARTDRPLLERHVNMSNVLARSAQGLKLSEKRVIALGLAKTDSIPAKDLALASREGWAVRLTAHEYAETYDIDPNTAYEQLMQAGDDLLKRQVRRLVETPKGLKEIKSNWCTGVTYHHGEGWVEVRYSFEIAPHLLGLRAQFTTYKLKQASALRSIYAWRLFECLQSWKGTGRWVVSVPDFCESMEAQPSHRANFGMLRRSIIEPAIKELTEKDGMEIVLNLEKSGRKVTGLSFTFQQNPQQVLPL